MSKFSLTNTSNGFKNFKSQQIEIKTKISQRELKKMKNNKNKNEIEKNNSISQMTDLEFEKLMEENENCIDNNFLNKIPCPNNISEKSKNILETGLKGEELVSYLSELNDKPNGIEFLNELLYNKINSNDVSWLLPNEYGSVLKYFFENDLDSQFLSLLMMQTYSKSLNYPKIEYKGSQKYLIRLLFQLGFTSEIIDETIYSKWEKYLSETNEIEESEKQTLLIQTTEFLMIFNTTFYEEDNENNENTQFGKNQNYIKPEEPECQHESEEPEEIEEPDNSDLKFQDYNLDDI